MTLALVGALIALVGFSVGIAAGSWLRSWRSYEQADRHVDFAAYDRDVSRWCDVTTKRIALDREILANQQKLIETANQGPQIVDAVIAAVNGSIGGRIGLGFHAATDAPRSVPATWRDKLAEYKRHRAAGHSRRVSFEMAMWLVEVPA